MSFRPTISVIVPCYNQCRFLLECVVSLQNQTYSDWECVIVNDGSPDNVAQVARELMTTDPRIRYVEKRNGGLSSARNAGLKEAKGRYVQFLDADDAILPTKFEVQLARIPLQDGLAVSICDYFQAGACGTLDIPDSNGWHLPPRLGDDPLILQLARDWETRLSIPAHCFLIDARIFRDHGVRFDTTLPNHEDWDCWMQIATLPISVVYCDEPLAAYRHHGASMSRNVARMRDGFLRAIDKQLRIHRNDPVLEAALSAKRKEMICTYAHQGAPLLSYRVKSAIKGVARHLFPSRVREFVRSMSRGKC